MDTHNPRMDMAKTCGIDLKVRMTEWFLLVLIGSSRDEDQKRQTSINVKQKLDNISPAAWKAKVHPTLQEAADSIMVGGEING